MTELSRSIRLPHATAMVIGTIIGASIFVQPSEITRVVPSVTGILGVWLVSGVLTLLGALVCAELASIYPRTGGVYVYLSESFSPLWGFLWGWAMFWSMHSGIVAVVAVVFARYVGYFTPLGTTGTKVVAIAAITALSFVNYLGVRQGSRLQTFFTAGKMIAVLAIVLLGAALGGRVSEHFVGTASPRPISASDFLTALVAGLFSYGGWHMVTYSAEETVDPRRTIPRSLLIGTLVVTAAYIAMNAVYLYVLPLDTVAASTRIAADAANAVLGVGAGGVMSVIVLFSSFGGLAGIVLAGPRVYYAMAHDGLLFRWFGEVHPKYRTPHRAIVLQGVWSAILVATGTFSALFTRVVYTEWIFFALMAAGLMVLRRKPGVKREYAMWGYPVTPILFIVASLAVVINQIVRRPVDAALGLGAVALGVPVYLIWGRRR
jgi:basic amino acid/polyamine antiporter, APA family